MLLDLEKASNALSSLKTTGGSKNLDSFNKDLEKFRATLPAKLNDAEFRYVMQTLFNDQIVTLSKAEAARLPAPTVLANGFQIRQAI